MVGSCISPCFNSSKKKGGFPIKRLKLIIGLGFVAISLLAIAGSAFAQVKPRTQSSSGAVDVLFIPSGGNTHYQVYRHKRVNDYNVTFEYVGQVQVDANGDIVAQSVPGSGDSFITVQPDVNSSKYVVFQDRNDIVDWEEYYYLVTEGTSYQNYDGLPENYLVVAAFPPNQTRHGSYTEFTGACTGCHGLHSAQSNEKLLKGPTASDLCGTCHDGTVSKYDEVRGRVQIGSNWAPAPAGPFGAQLPGGDPENKGTAWASSVHNVYNSDQTQAHARVWQAPGSGFNNAATGNTGSGTDFSQVGWNNWLSCISCHEPHNKFVNFRLLRNDINDKKTGDGDQPAGGIAIRGVSETGKVPAGDGLWPQAYTDFGSIVGGQVYISQTKFLANTARFCSQCHRAFYNEAVRTADDRVISKHIDSGLVNPGSGESAIRAYFNGLIGLGPAQNPPSPPTAVSSYCGTCHKIIYQNNNGETVITTGPNWAVYLGWTTGNANLATGDGADMNNVMGAGHRHPTQVPARRILFSGKAIEGTFAPNGYITTGKIQPRVKPGPVNVGVPLELPSERQTNGLGDPTDPAGYAYYDVVCLTCHMAHGSRAGINDSSNPWLPSDKKLESAYLNGDLNGTTGAIQHPVSMYYRTSSGSGVSSVLARFTPMASVCYRCHSTD